MSGALTSKAEIPTARSTEPSDRAPFCLGSGLPEAVGAGTSGTPASPAL